RWERLDRDRGEEQPQVADEVDGIRGGRARPRDQHAGERGSDDPGRLPEDLVERDGCGHQLGADQSRRRRLPRRAVDRAQSPREQVRHVQQQERGVAADRARDQPARDRHVPDLRPDQDPPAIVSVDERPTDERPGHAADERRDTEQSDLRRRSRERVDLDGEPDADELRTERRDQRAAPQQAEVARDAERCHIDRDATKTPRHGRTLTGRSRGPYPKAVSTAPSSTSRPSASSGSSIVSGGSSRMTLPYVPALSTITPPSSAARVIRFIVSVTSGSFVSGSSTSSIAHIAPRPRTSPTCG